MKKKIVSKTLAILLASGALVSVASCDKISGTTTVETPSNTTGGAVTPTPTPTPTPVTPTTPPATTTTPAPTPTPEVHAAIELDGVEYKSIKEALAAIPTSGDTKTYTIRLEKGTYTENGLSYDGSATVKIVGATDAKYGVDVIIKGHGSDMNKMRGRELLEIQGTGNIILENITLESDWSRADHKGDVQAEVLGTDTKGNTVAYNCSFKSHQDTLRTAGKAWFYGCYIEGDTDFIWMEASGSVALYEKCEIVSLYDENATTHSSYLTAPRMAVSFKVGKGLVIYNSTVKEANKEQATYLARTPWSSGYYNQVAYINTICEGVEANPWYKNQIATEYPKTIIGWKMDKATADSIGYAGNNDIVDADTVSKEYGGRKAILNRIYNTGKGKYEKDVANSWDIDEVIAQNNFVVDADSSSDVLTGEVIGESTIYEFDGSVDQSVLCSGFAREGEKNHYRGGEGATITIPVKGKSYVEIYGYYAGTAEVKADTQNEAVLFFNNGTTNSQVEQDYIVYDENAKNIVITAKATTYITRVVVTEDPTIARKDVSEIKVTGSSTKYIVGVSLRLSASVSSDATNRSIKWSSSDETIGVVDQYTGKVTFKKAGTVTFTATALDGSGVSDSITCEAKESNWTVAEWYTTDNTLEAEDGAQGIDNFDINKSAYKNLTSSQTYTNLAGESFTTSKGLKLNSAGLLTISTTKGVTLTVVTGPANCLTATPKVNNGTKDATLVSTTSQGDLIIYVYRLEDAGTWNITRSDTSKENNPIIYAKAECDKEVISETTGFNFKGGAYSGTNVKNCNSNDTILLDTNKTTYEKVTFEGCSSHGQNDWLNFNTGATISFNVSKACKLNICFYNGKNNATVKLGDTEISTSTDSTDADYKTKYEYAITGEGLVTIAATSNGGYIGYFEVVIEDEATSDVFEEDTTLDFATGKADATLSNSKITKSSDLKYNNNNYTQLTAGSFSFKVAANATVTVVPFDANYGYCLINGVSNESQNYTHTFEEETVITIAFDAKHASNCYIRSISISYPAPSNVISESTSFVLGSNNQELTALCTNGVIQGSSVKCGAFEIDATNGKLRLNGGDNAQLNTGTTITFKVARGAVVTVEGYPNLFAYSVKVGDATELVATEAITVLSATIEEETIIVIKATDNQYIKTISIAFNN